MITTGTYGQIIGGGGGNKFCFLKNSQNIRLFQTKQFTWLLEFTKLYKQNPIWDFSTIYPNYTLGWTVQNIQ